MQAMSVTHTLFGALGGEVPVEDVRHHANGIALMPRLAAIGNLRTKTFGLHQTPPPMSAAAFAGFPQIHDDFAVPIHSAAGQPVMLDQSEKTLIFAVTCTAAIAQPCVIPATVNFQATAHRNQPKFVKVPLHECVRRPHLLANCAADIPTLRLPWSRCRRRHMGLR